MDAHRAFLVIFFFAALIMANGVYATTVLVTVSELKENLTPVSQAMVYADNSLVGKTDDLGTVEFSHPDTGGSIEISVVKRGYDEWTGMLGQNQTSLPVEMTRKNLSFRAEVFDSDTLEPIPGASVSLDDGGTRTISTDSNGTASFSVKANSVISVRISAPNYQTRESSIEIGVDLKTVQFWLYPEERFAVLVRERNSGNPVSGAEIYFDGVLKGVSDPKGALTIDLPRDKVYTMEIKKDGFVDLTEKRIIGKDEALVILNMEKVPFTLTVSVFDQDNRPIQGADISVDGSSAGITNRYGTAKVENLSYGTYSVSAFHEGYLNASRDVLVGEKGEDTVFVLDYEMVPVTFYTEEKDGRRIAGALVSLDNTFVGITDSEGKANTKIRSMVKQTINASKEGYLPATTQVFLNSSQKSSTVRLVMEPSLNLLFMGGLIAVIVIIVAGVILVLRGRSSRGFHRAGRRGL